MARRTKKTGGTRRSSTSQRGQTATAADKTDPVSAHDIEDATIIGQAEPGTDDTASEAIMDDTGDGIGSGSSSDEKTEASASEAAAKPQDASDIETMADSIAVVQTEPSEETADASGSPDTEPTPGDHDASAPEGRLGDDTVNEADQVTTDSKTAIDEPLGSDNKKMSEETTADDDNQAAEDGLSGVSKMEADTVSTSEGETPGVADGKGNVDEAKSGATSFGPTLGMAAAPQVIEKRGPGFVPLVLGGLVAGLIGYGLSTYLQAPPPAGNDRIAALEAEVAALQEEGGTRAPVDLSPLETAQAALADRVSALETALAALPPDASAAGPAEGASTADVAPVPDVSDIRTALAEVSGLVDAVTAELADLAGRVEVTSGQVADLTGRVDAFDPAALAGLAARVEGLGTAVAELQARADANIDDAEAVAREAARSQLALAMESGLPYADALAQLPDAPEALQANAADGVPTVAALAADFPALSRAALREARAATPGDVGLGSLAGRFLNARSLEPREGDDPDAVLSRAEAAVRAGDVDAALAEIAALPDVARAPLADWIARAEARATVQAALNAYLQDG